MKGGMTIIVYFEIVLANTFSPKESYMTSFLFFCRGSLCILNENF
jgi:hypothetical protein